MQALGAPPTYSKIPVSLNVPLHPSSCYTFSLSKLCSQAQYPVFCAVDVLVVVVVDVVVGSDQWLSPEVLSVFPCEL